MSGELTSKYKGVVPSGRRRLSSFSASIEGASAGSNASTRGLTRRAMLANPAAMLTRRHTPSTVRARRVLHCT